MGGWNLPHFAPQQNHHTLIQYASQLPGRFQSKAQSSIAVEVSHDVMKRLPRFVALLSFALTAFVYASLIGFHQAVFLAAFNFAHRAIEINSARSSARSVGNMVPVECSGDLAAGVMLVSFV